MAQQRILAGALIACAVLASSAAAQATAPESVPADLRPLLAPRHSELRLVTLRYSADRNLLSGNYAGGNGAGRGRGNAPADSGAALSVDISPERIARLRHFDTSWRGAVAKLDTSRLSPDARVDLDSLKSAIGRNLARADAETSDLELSLPLFPFAPRLVGLIEARLRLEDVNSERAAGVLTAVVKEIGAAINSVRLGGGIAGSVSRTDVSRSIATVTGLKNNLGAWFNFYNGYDPQFTWWMGLPYKHADTALQWYLTFMRDSVHAPEQPSMKRVAGSLTFHDDWPIGIPVVPYSRFYFGRDDMFTLLPEPPRHVVVEPKSVVLASEVPDLAEIIALPQDEMTEVVNLYLGRGANGGRGRGPVPPVVPPRDATFYQQWLAALKTLDFDQLSRNAQVDYLYLKKLAELKLARQGPPLPTDAPRKTDNTGIPGGAAGRDSLIRDLQDQLIPYTPEQLMALAEKEFAWTTAEMIKASRQMGFGNNWKAALEKTKTMHVPPGGQPGMIRDLIYDAIDYLREHDLITVPQVASESMRMSMMSAQAQLANPFFLGGSEIQVSYPTDGMEFDAREQSMRGNNRPWSHATAFHEMIPGHNLQGFNNQRFGVYRAALNAGGPFYVEGWALYWELILYDKGFDKTPEEKVGALFWRMHRCARIIFSLKFHMGQWSPQEAIDFLVDRVGHERDNATAEVNRSFRGGYGPLYQAAYLLGGLELRGLRRELVDTHQMSEKAFHDEIMRQGSMPIALLRLAMTRQKLTRDMPIDWKFYGDLPDR